MIKRMNVLAIVMFAIGFLHPSHAQFVRAYGVKAGYTSASQKFTYTTFGIDAPKRRSGFVAGVYAEFLDLSMFSVVAQLEYAQRGMGVEFMMTGPFDPTPIGTITKWNRLDYLSIPLYAKVRLPAGVLSPFIIAGPRIDILLGYSSDDGLNNAVYDSFKDTMFGASLGAGVEVSAVFSVVVLLEGRYNFDFSDSFNTPLLTVRNNAFDFWLGVML